MTLPLSPSINIITSFLDFPVTVIASNPESFTRGKKYPPTFESQNVFVRGEIDPIINLPVPTNPVSPQKGPPARANTFSGLLNSVEALVPSKTYFKQ